MPTTTCRPVRAEPESNNRHAMIANLLAKGVFSEIIQSARTPLPCGDFYFTGVLKAHGHAR